MSRQIKDPISGSWLTIAGYNAIDNALDPNSRNPLQNKVVTTSAGNWVGLTITASIGAATIQKNDMLKLAIITWRAGSSGTGSGTITLPSGMSVKHATIEGLRKGGYLDAAQNATTITITDAAAYDVGQIMFTYN